MLDRKVKLEGSHILYLKFNDSYIVPVFNLVFSNSLSSLPAN